MVSGIGLSAERVEADMTRPSRTGRSRYFEPCPILLATIKFKDIMIYTGD